MPNFKPQFIMEETVSIIKLGNECMVVSCVLLSYIGQQAVETNALHRGL